jgi:glutamyl-tRNA synthetase
MNPSGSKMSKRQSEGQVHVHDFRKDGYAPWPLLNYLANLGWSIGDNKEQYTLAEMLEKFDPSNISKSNARFDYKKCASFNRKYLNTLSDSDLIAEVSKYGNNFEYEKIDQLVKQNYVVDDIVLLNKGTVNNLKEFYTNSNFMIYQNIDSTIIQDFDDRIGWIAYYALLEEKNWDNADTLEVVVKNIANNLGVKAGVVAMPIRIAITGQKVSPPIGRVLKTLGKEEFQKRFLHYCSMTNKECVNA